MQEAEIIDPSFRKYVIPNAWVERLYTGVRWAEGPVYFGDGRFFVWSDIPNNRMMRWAEETGEVGVFRSPSNYSNGNTRDREGRLVSCEHGTRRVTRTEADGRLTVLADSYRGKRLNSPNDVVVKSDGSIWFTDPNYGIMTDYEGFAADSEVGGCYVYCLDPADGKLRVVADDFVKPNGLAFSADESLLYVSDSGFSHDDSAPHHIRRFKVSSKGKLSGGKVFADVTPGIPDGVRIDEDGNLWTSAGDGVQCFSADGALLGKIRIPEVVANLTFGGPKKNRLFITATTSIYSVFVGVRGIQRP